MPSGSASLDASHGPAIAPSVPPTAITPKSRLLCSSANRSAISAQNTIVANRLKTLNQTKNTIPLASPMAWGAPTRTAQNPMRVRPKKTYVAVMKTRRRVRLTRSTEQRVHREGDDRGPTKSQRTGPRSARCERSRPGRSNMSAVR